MAWKSHNLTKLNLWICSVILNLLSGIVDNCLNKTQKFKNWQFYLNQYDSHRTDLFYRVPHEILYLIFEIDYGLPQQFYFYDNLKLTLETYLASTKRIGINIFFVLWHILVVFLLFRVFFERDSFCLAMAVLYRVFISYIH